MKKIVMCGLFFFQLVHAGEPFEKYFSYIEQLAKPNGSYKKGEIEILTDPAEMVRIEKIQESRLLKKGFSASAAVESSRVGLVSEDQYWIWLRDAVYFPKGIPGTYDRLIWKSELKNSIPGIAVLPILPSGQIVLNLNYR